MRSKTPIYDASSRAYLTRAKLNFDSGKNNLLFYAAFELRCGIEARLKEYVVRTQGESIPIRKIPWKIKELRKTLAKSSEFHGRRFAFTFIHPKTREKCHIIYNPVSRKLQKIAERLGKFLHCVGQSQISELFFSEFRQLVKQGIEELKLATSGTLVAPPLVSGRGKMKFKFEKGQIPSLFKDPKIKQLRFRFQIVRSPTPDNPFYVVKPI